MKTYRLEGEILSPVHIGTSQVWEPLEYYIDSTQNQLHQFSTEEILARLNEIERQEFYKLIDQENLKLVKNFITQKAKSQGGSNGKHPIPVSPAVGRLYDEKIDDIANQLLIQPMIRTKDSGGVILPGSSLKGAIRTAIISQIAGNSDLPKPRKHEIRFFESNVLEYKDAKNDPFRAVKIADAFLGTDATFICQVFNCSKNKDNVLQPTKIQLIHEVTHSELSFNIYGKHVTFETELRLDDALMRDNRAVSRKISVEEILSACNHFYRDKMEMEHDKFYEGSFMADESAQLLDIPISENECLLRVGRFSGVESVTLDEYRDPQPPGKDKRWGFSRNIADERFPMGWIKIRLIPQA